MVLFITGLCDKGCWYCPVSRDKMYRDVVYANERQVHVGEWDGLLEEAVAMDAKGAGITGGDPMVVPHRVMEISRLLKAEFGPEFHLHLYTSCEFDISVLEDVKAAGLDEIRFHPDPEEYGAMEDSWHDAAIREAIRVGLTTQVEIPCIPGRGDDIVALAHYLESVGAHGLNLNELEASPPNAAALRERSLEMVDDESQSIAGSRETALAVLDSWRAHRMTTGSRFTVHFCSSPYKDAIQLTQRLRRRAGTVAREFEEVSEEGTLAFGVLRPADGLAGELAERLRAEFEVPPQWIDIKDGAVETAPAVAEELAESGCFEDLGVTGWISEVYPTSDRIEVERIPLPLVDLNDP